MKRMNPLLLLLAAALLVGTGCSSTKKQTAEAGKPVSGTDEQIFIGDTIEKNYDPNVIMKRAEAFFEKEEYAESVIEYQHFLDLHRSHVLAPYAQFRLADSYLKMSKSVDRDPGPIRHAQDMFEKLLRDYPGSRYELEAKERIKTCQDLLAQSYMFVGQFYMRRESYLAAAYRFESIVEKFPDLPVAQDALFFLAKAYTELGAYDWAQERLIALTTKYPTNTHVPEGKKLLAKLNGKMPLTTAIAKADGIAIAPEIASLPPDQFPGQAAPPQIAAITGLGTVKPAIGSSFATPRSIDASFTQPATLCRIDSWC